MCGKETEEQTKNGPCELDVYHLTDTDLPAWLIETFNDTTLECEHCKKRLHLKIDYEFKVTGITLEPSDNLDYVDWKVQNKNRELHGNNTNIWTKGEQQNEPTE